MGVDTFDILKVIGRYVAVEKRGAAYVALCPFHADKHPSLRINPSKGLYHCFSCGAGGDALRFVMEKEGCDFKAALRICEDLCGTLHTSRTIHIPGCCRDGACPVSTTTGNMDLLPYDPGDEGLRQAYADFGVGLAPSDPPKEYAFTRGRLVFPIHDGEGTIVAYAARYLGDPLPKGCPKYLNSPTSDLYKKDELLYGWHRALPRIRQTGTIILVEGYKDALAMHAAGLTNTVALCGVHLSDHHAAMLRKEARTVCLFLDNDEPGRVAAGKIGSKLTMGNERLTVGERGRSPLSVIHCQPSAADCPLNKDADELYRTLGPAALRSWVSEASVPAARREAEDDLIRACVAHPDTLCVTEDGSLRPYIFYIRELLEFEELWPEIAVNRFTLSNTNPSLREEGPAGGTEQVRDSQRIEGYLLRYLELRLSNRIRLHARQLRHDTGANRAALLSLLQDDREYLREVSERLGRIG